MLSHIVVTPEECPVSRRSQSHREECHLRFSCKVDAYRNRGDFIPAAHSFLDPYNLIDAYYWQHICKEDIIADGYRRHLSIVHLSREAAASKGHLPLDVRSSFVSSPFNAPPAPTQRGNISI